MINRMSKLFFVYAFFISFLAPQSVHSDSFQFNIILENDYSFPVYAQVVTAKINEEDKVNWFISKEIRLQPGEKKDAGITEINRFFLTAFNDEGKYLISEGPYLWTLHHIISI
jgi:hypothetical protein